MAVCGLRFIPPGQRPQGGLQPSQGPPCAAVRTGNRRVAL